MTSRVKTDPPGNLNLIAHSRGGLATLEAVTNTKLALSPMMSPEEVNEAMSHINIASYGSAETGWPVGPVYKKVDNVADPVPGIIKGAQQAFAKKDAPPTDTTPTRYINDPKLNPIDAHSLDNVYANQMVRAPGPRDCDCS